MANEKLLEFPIGITKYGHLALHFWQWDMPEVGEADSRFEKKGNLGDIYLYVPDGITDGVSTNWGQEETFQNVSNQFANWVSGMSSKVGGGLATRGKAEAGVAALPNQALVLQSPGWFDLSLSWDMAPENLAEAENIKAIMKKLRAASLPTYSSAGVDHLNYPPILDVDIYTATQSDLGSANYKEEKQNILHYKNLVITSYSASYSGDGGSMLYYHTGHPMNVKISITLKSVLPIWNEE